MTNSKGKEIKDCFLTAEAIARVFRLSLQDVLKLDQEGVLVARDIKGQRRYSLEESCENYSDFSRANRIPFWIWC